MSRSSSRLTPTGVPIRRSRLSAWPSARRAIAARRSLPPSTRRMFWRSPRRSASTAARRGSPVRCSSASTPTPCRSPPSTAPLEVFAANGVETMISRGGEYTPTPAVSQAILVHNRGRTRRARRRHRHHPVAQSARGWRLQVQSAQRRPGRHRDHELDREAGQRLLADGLRDLRRLPLAEARARSLRARVRFPRELRRRPRQRHRLRRDSRLRHPHGRRPAGRRRRALLGAHRRALPHRSRRGQRPGRSAVRLHDARLGRPHPHGSRPRRTPCGGWSGSRTSTTSPFPATPTTTGTASWRPRRPDAAQPLPGRRDRLPVPPSAGLERRRRRWARRWSAAT